MEEVNITIEFRIFEDIKYQSKLTTLIFWTTFAQKRCFWSKKEKVNIIIEFCIFELVYNTSHKLLRPSQFLEKIMEILEWTTLQK